MIEFFINNLGTILVSLVILAIVAAILIGMQRDKKKGKHTCGGNCASCSAGCAHSSAYHKSGT